MAFVAVGCASATSTSTATDQTEAPQFDDESDELDVAEQQLEPAPTLEPTATSEPTATPEPTAAPAPTEVAVESWPSELIKTGDIVEWGDGVFVAPYVTRTPAGAQAVVFTSVDGENWTQPSDYPVDVPADSLDIDIERVGDWWVAVADANYSDILRISKDLINWQPLDVTPPDVEPAPEGMYWQSKLNLSGPSPTFVIRTKLWNDLRAAGTAAEQPQPSNPQAITRVVTLTAAGELETIHETTGTGNLPFQVVYDLGDGDLILAIRDGNWKTYTLNPDGTRTGTPFTFPDPDPNSILRMAAHAGRIYAQAAPDPEFAQLVVSEDRGRTWQTAATFETSAALAGINQFATGPTGEVATTLGEGEVAIIYSADGINFEQIHTARRTTRETDSSGRIASQSPIRDLAINNDTLVYLTDLGTQLNTIELAQ